MAMRQKIPTFRAQPSLRPVYEDFQPMSKMTENPDAYILQIQLPGFTKDRVRITYVTTVKMVRITGERPIDNNNKWSRFNQSYSVPKDCEVEKIQGNFDRGVLTITMPKKFITQSPQEEAKTSPEKLPSPSKTTSPAEPMPEKEKTTTRDEDSRDKKAASSSIPSPGKGPEKVQQETEPKPFLKPVPRRRMDDEKAQTVEEDSEPKPMLKPAPGRKTDEITQKGPDETQQKIASTLVPKKPGDEEKDRRDSEQIEPKLPMLKPIARKDSDEMIQKGLEQIRQRITATTLPRKQKEDDDDKNNERLIQKEGHKASKARKPRTDVKEGIIKDESKEKSQLGLTKAADQVSGAPKTSKKEMEITKKTRTGEKDKKEDDIVETIGKGMKEVAASASQAVAKISEGTLNNEEKRSLLNMGAAAMVIAALGAYVTYRFTTGKP